MYWHEHEERKTNVHPMCTTLPAQSPLQHNMRLYLQARCLSVDIALFNGWYESTDCNDNYKRVVIPAITHKVGHVYWQARDIFGKAFIRYQSPKGPRHEALIRITPITLPLGIVVVEGPMDALAAAGEGYLAFALMGMVPSDATLFHLALLIQDYEDQKIIVLLDRDSSAAAVKVVTFLASQGYDASMAQMPGPEKDLAECMPATRKRLLRQKFQSSLRLKNYRKQAKTETRA